MSKLGALLAPGAVELDAPAADWRAAITRAGRLLEASGSATADYTQAMIKTVEDNGPYILVAPGFAFAHARPSEAVRHTAISWVRLAEPVRFGHSTNDPVTLVVALAARDDFAHTRAMKELARVLGDAEKQELLAVVTSEGQLRNVLDGYVPTAAANAIAMRREREAREAQEAAAAAATGSAAPTTGPAARPDGAVESKGKILTVCGNGLGTSLFLKNTLDGVLGEWGWSPYFTVEATDTISAKGRASEADVLLTSGEIAAALGDVGVPVYVIDNFTSAAELDRALREIYDIPAAQEGR
ncbi:PTS sugar transporter subunit IIA [Corynebacterium confusum]|uniref:PTS sugar transporter subunit IIA n=1 Tax=Corynebacterium confusum TaxID=71254 RepID=UPI0025B55F2A|nr:PTS sugar transporter subunit IIA [Corynebacterium confusum]WJY89149.1 Ascorbate-specific phosphotransferase enzyme IIA component [Corynebacterium confusum]